MATVTVPVPIALAGGALLLLGGFLVGAVAGPGAASRATAQVVSYDPADDQLCLTGDDAGGRTGPRTACCAAPGAATWARPTPSRATTSAS